uniref:Apple domain-containing protein n=1 Tax=Caenorhabditis tropicalis TaxID=1561998 RepID=A0A1I7T081_9PELO
MLQRPFFLAILVALLTLSAALYRSKDVFSCFVLHSNEFLEKSGNVLIEDIDDVNECLRKCIQAPMNHKIKCKTVMYNVNTQNCVLSKYARHERTIKKSKGLQIDLYENRCATSENETIRLAVFTEQTRTTAAPVRMASSVIGNVILNISNSTTTNPPIITTQQAIQTTNELRRVHAVKQFPLEQKNGNLIFSKTVYADQPSPSLLPQRLSDKRNRNARVFVSPRPLVDSTSTVVLTPIYQQQQLQSDQPSLIKERRQRSERPPVFENLAACFIKTPNRVLHKFEESRIGGVTLETCMRQCSQNALNFYCASINYSFGLKICTLNGGNLHLNGGETLVASREFDYFENTCQPRGTTTTESCESECSWSHIRRREKCLGVNWIPTTRGCMLFHKQIDFNILQPSFKAQFLANTCTYTTDQSSSRSTSSKSDPDYYDPNH